MILITNKQRDQIVWALENMVHLCERHEYSDSINERRRAKELVAALKKKKAGTYELFT